MLDESEMYGYLLWVIVILCSLAEIWLFRTARYLNNDRFMMYWGMFCCALPIVASLIILWGLR